MAFQGSELGDGGSDPVSSPEEEEEQPRLPEETAWRAWLLPRNGIHFPGYGLRQEVAFSCPGLVSAPRGPGRAQSGLPFAHPCWVV